MAPRLGSLALAEQALHRRGPSREIFDSFSKPQSAHLYFATNALQGPCRFRLGWYSKIYNNQYPLRLQTINILHSLYYSLNSGLYYIQYRSFFIDPRPIGNSVTGHGGYSLAGDQKGDPVPPNPRHPFIDEEIL